MKENVSRAAGAGKDADKKGCIIKSLIKIKEMNKNKEKSIKTDTKLNSLRGANGFRAEIADRDPKAYYIRREGASGDSKQKYNKLAEKPWFFNLKLKQNTKMKKGDTLKKYIPFLFAVMPKYDSPKN